VADRQPVATAEAVATAAADSYARIVAALIHVTGTGRWLRNRVAIVQCRYVSKLRCRISLKEILQDDPSLTQHQI